MVSFSGHLELFFGQGNWLGTTSGLTALQVALKVAGVKHGSIVACDPIFPYSALAATNLGAKIYFYDVDIENEFAVEVRDIGQTATVLTSYFGKDPIANFQPDPSNLIIDRCQCFGKISPDLSPRATVHSFQSGKFVNCGHGGAINFRTKDDLQFAERYISLGWRRETGKEVNWKLDPANRSLGISARLSPILSSHIISNSSVFHSSAQKKRERFELLWDSEKIRILSFWNSLPNFPWKIPIQCGAFSSDIVKLLDRLNLNVEENTVLPAHLWPCFDRVKLDMLNSGQYPPMLSLNYND